MEKIATPVSSLSTCSSKCAFSWKFSLYFLVLILFSVRLCAQCTTAIYGKYPPSNVTVAACNGSPQIIVSDGYASEYSVVNVVTGQLYTFTSSIGSDFITIATGSTTASAVAYGTGSVTQLATSSGAVNFYVHSNASCGGSSSERTRSVSCGGTLAISMQSISVKNMGRTNRIDWATAAEHMGDYFELERRSEGTVFLPIATIPVMDAPSGYSHFDSSPFSGVNYYRLKLFGPNGSTGYSEIVNARVGLSEGNVLKVFYSSKDNTAVVSLFGAVDGNLTVSDISGRTVLRTRMLGPELKIAMEGFASGVYMVRYTSGQVDQVVKLYRF